MKKFTLLLVLLFGIAGGAKLQAQVEWTIWEGTATQTNVIPNLISLNNIAVGDIIYVYCSAGTPSKVLYRISGDNWDTWTDVTSYAAPVSDGSNYYHVVTSELLTQLDLGNNSTKSWAIGNWAEESTITKVTIKRGTSMIKSTLSDDSKTFGNWTGSYTIAAISNLEINDFIYIPATVQTSYIEDEEEKTVTWWNVQFQNMTTEPWSNFINYAGDNGTSFRHDIWWKIDDNDDVNTIKSNGVFINGQYYNTSGVYLYHPISSFSIGKIGYATFSANQQVTAPNTVTAYKGTISGDNLVLSPFTNNVIPANTGAIIAGEQGAVLEFTASSAETSETSALQAVTTATEVASLASGNDYYILYDNITNTALSLDDSDVNLVWNSATYSSKTMTLGAAWGSCGWQTNDVDYSAYEKVVVEFNEATTIPGSLKIGYTTGEDEVKDFAVGATSVELAFDKTRSNHVKWIYITGNEQTSGSYTFKSAYLMKHTPEFRKTTSGTLAANKAYLAIPTGTGARALNIVFDDEQETTAIESVAPQTLHMDNVYYNLRGQRVAQPTKGLYIVNGKKVIIK